MDNRVKLLFEDMSLCSDYQLLEWGKDTDELKEIAIKRGITVPSKDLSIFKCKYAMVDQANKNKCTLPRKEVKKALKTLVGKAIDKDHFRQSTIGYWLDSELVDDEIIAYGAFWKSNFPEEHAIIQDRMTKGKMKISFEAWGDREFRDDGSYNLNNIEFAGGALLFDSDPAFPDAEVMEFSHKDRVLEFAKIVEDTTVDEAKKKKKEKEHECAKKGCQKCGEMFDEEDLNNNLCPNCQVMRQTPLPDEESNKEDNSLTKLPQDEAEITKRAKELMTEQSHQEGGNTVDEILKKYNKANVEEFSKFVDESLASLKAKEEEVATLTKKIEESTLVIENAKLEVEKVKTEFEGVKAELEKRLAAEKAAIVKTRRDDLGEEFAKDITDEDIMNDLKFENAKLRKELATAKAKVEEASKKTDGLEGGKKVETPHKSFEKQANVQKRVFGTETK